MGIWKQCGRFPNALCHIFPSIKNFVRLSWLCDCIVIHSQKLLARFIETHMVSINTSWNQFILSLRYPLPVKIIPLQIPCWGWPSPIFLSHCSQPRPPDSLLGPLLSYYSQSVVLILPALVQHFRNVTNTNFHIYQLIVSAITSSVVYVAISVPTGLGGGHISGPLSNNRTLQMVNTPFVDVNIQIIKEALWSKCSIERADNIGIHYCFTVHIWLAIW